VSNVLNEEKRQQVIALGRLGWSLRRLNEPRTSGVKPLGFTSDRREPGGAARRVGAEAAKTGNEVITDPTPAKPAMK